MSWSGFLRPDADRKVGERMQHLSRFKLLHHIYIIFFIIPSMKQGTNVAVSLSRIPRR